MKKFGFSFGVIIGAAILVPFGIFNSALIFGMIGTSLIYEFGYMK